MLVGAVGLGAAAGLRLPVALLLAAVLTVSKVAKLAALVVARATLEPRAHNVGLEGCV